MPCFQESYFLFAWINHSNMQAFTQDTSARLWLSNKTIHFLSVMHDCSSSERRLLRNVVHVVILIECSYKSTSQEYMQLHLARSGSTVLTNCQFLFNLLSLHIDITKKLIVLLHSSNPHVSTPVTQTGGFSIKWLQFKLSRFSIINL